MIRPAQAAPSSIMTAMLVGSMPLFTNSAKGRPWEAAPAVTVRMATSRE